MPAAELPDTDITVVMPWLLRAEFTVWLRRNRLALYPATDDPNGPYEIRPEARPEGTHQPVVYSAEIQGIPGLPLWRPDDLKQAR